MTTTVAPPAFDGCREQLDELVRGRADMDAVERVIDAFALDRDSKDALWLWASGRRDRLARQPSRPATSNGERHDDLW
ncbi:MAG: hypothetical protein QOJ85_269 [Solirubrobacteraceae bacterium]|jgi:hypothetical protein|nr:hypothetical protein [Solirubrobacteraceae bacterium]MEA2244857.1 hypothetical protein [Solirubrobacteraceae bacterium]